MGSRRSEGGRGPSGNEAFHFAEEDEKARHLPARVVPAEWRLCPPGGTRPVALSLSPQYCLDPSDPQVLLGASFPAIANRALHLACMMPCLGVKGKGQPKNQKLRRRKVMRRRMLVAEILAGLLLFASAALAQGEERHEISVQGTGFFTKDTEGNGISQHSTDTGGFLAGYRFHFNRWLAADASYGYVRNTLQNVTSARQSNLQSNIHQTTGALVVTFPCSVV